MLHVQRITRHLNMELEDRANALHLEQQHKNHIASLMINNAKSSLASGVALPDSVTGVYNSEKVGMKNNDTSSSSHTDDELGNSSRSHKSNDETQNKSTKTMNTGRWSGEEHKRFLAGLDQFGTGNWKKITDMVGTRSCTQIRTHAQKYFIALQKPQNDGSDNGGYARKKSKMLVGADHHLNSNIKTGSSAIITGYGGGGTPIHPSGIMPVTGTMGTASSKSTSGGNLKQFWGPEGLRDHHSAGLTGMEVLAQAAITGEKRMSSTSSDDHPPMGKLQGHTYHTQYESSLDKAVAELRKKMASEADAAAIANNARRDREAVKPNLPCSSVEAAKEIAESEGNKRKLSDARAAAVISSYQEHKKLKESNYAAAVQDTIDRKDVLNKLQAVAERQEFLRLRQEVKTLNQTIIQMQQQSIESDNRVMEAITDRRVTLNECKNLREINAQLKNELRRMVLLFEHSGANNHGNSSALMVAATQGANAELMQARLTESELRYHTVTESLSRQTGVLTDQHRAILELNNQLEKERAKRQRIEYELKELKTVRLDN